MILPLFAIAAFGIGLASVALEGRAPLLVRVFVGVCLGAAAWSATFAALLLCGFTSPSARFGKDAALVLAGVLLLWRAGEAGRTQRPKPAPAWLAATFASACALAAALFVEHALRFPDGGWDAWMIWNLRARSIARAGAAFRSAFSPELVFWAHQDYPWMLPGMVAQGFLASGTESPAVPVAIAGALAALAVGLLVAALGHLRGMQWGLLGGLALVSTPCFVTFAANQQSDVPMGTMLLLATVLLALALEDERRPAKLFALAGLSASMAAWTKNEGALYTLALAAALLLQGPGAPRDRARAAGLFLAGAAPIGALLAYFKLAMAHTNDLLHYTSGPTALQRATDLHRWGELGLAWLRRLVYFQNWGLWLLALVAALALFVRKPPASSRVILTALALAYCAYVPMYILQPHPLLWFFRASIDRLFMHLWPSAILATLLALVPAAGEARAAVPLRQG